MRSRIETCAVLQAGSQIDCFEIVDHIGHGGYGEIYEVRFQNSPVIYAMKVSPIESGKKGLVTEISVMLDLQDSPLFPKLIRFGSTLNLRYLTMELLGASMSNTRRKMFRKHFSVATTLRLAFFMLQCIEDFHRHGYVHCDIKPGNFVFCLNQSNPLKLIDYGLSKQFIDRDNGIRLPEKPRFPFTGTNKYASLNCYSSKDLSPRDDLYSWLYSLVELLEGKLPWSRLKKPAQVERMKRTISPQHLFSSFPSEILEIWRYISNLSFTDLPDYELIFDKVLRALSSICSDPFIPFDWESLDEDDIKELSPNANLPEAKNMKMDFLLPPMKNILRDGEEHCCKCLLL